MVNLYKNYYDGYNRNTAQTAQEVKEATNTVIHRFSILNRFDVERSIKVNEPKLYAELRKSEIINSLEHYIIEAVWEGKYFVNIHYHLDNVRLSEELEGDSYVLQFIYGELYDMLHEMGFEVLIEKVKTYANSKKLELRVHVAWDNRSNENDDNES